MPKWKQTNQKLNSKAAAWLSLNWAWSEIHSARGKTLKKAIYIGFSAIFSTTQRLIQKPSR